MRHVAETLDLCLQIADLLALPIEDVSSNGVPCYAIRESNGFCGGEDHLGSHHLWRLRVVAANLIDPERDCLVLARVLTLDDQHRNAIDKKHDIFARAVVAVMPVE